MSTCISPVQMELHYGLQYSRERNCKGSHVEVFIISVLNLPLLSALALHSFLHLYFFFFFIISPLCFINFECVIQN